MLYWTGVRNAVTGTVLTCSAWALAGTMTVAAADNSMEACQLGKRVLSVGMAIRDLSTPNALKVITELGADSRYYTMVRGWLAMQLRGDLSIINAGKSGERPELEARVAFLKNAIRAIDLE